MGKNKYVVKTRSESINKIIKREKKPFKGFSAFKRELARVEETREKYGDTPELQELEERIRREEKKVVLGRVAYSVVFLSTLFYHETYALRLYAFGCIYGAIEFGKCYKREIFNNQIQLYLANQTIDNYELLTDELQERCKEQEKTIAGYKLRLKRRKERLKQKRR